MSKEIATKTIRLIYDEREREIFSLEEKLISLFRERGDKEYMIELEERLITLKCQHSNNITLFG